MAAPSVGVAIPEINEPMATKGASNSHLAFHKTNFNGSDSVCACCIDTVLFKADILDGLLFKNPPNTSKQKIIKMAGIKPATNMVLIGTLAMMAYMMSGTDGANKTPSELALVIKPMLFDSG